MGVISRAISWYRVRLLYIIVCKTDTFCSGNCRAKAEGDAAFCL
jgi:hypothetical protein